MRIGTAGRLAASFLAAALLGSAGSALGAAPAASGHKAAGKHGGGFTAGPIAITGGAPEATLPFDLVNSSVFIPVTVDGKAMRFVFDTGGRNLLTQQAAKKLHLKSRGRLKMIPGGKNRPPTAVGVVRSIDVGGKVTMRHQKILVVGLPGFWKTEGARLDGLVGKELLNRFVVRIDYADRKLTFMEPSAFDAGKAGQAVPIVGFMGGDPLVRAKLDGIAATLVVDTGSHEPLLLFKPFADKHKLIARYKTTPETVVGWGFGGKIAGRAARGCKLELGRVRYRDPVLVLAGSAKGATGIKQIAGDLGGPVLRHYTVTFDYPDRKIYLKAPPGQAAPHDYDRSGMWVNQQGDDFAVRGVMPGGPAARAGIRAGDVVTTVDGRKSGSLTLSGFRSMLRQAEPGKRMTLGLRGHSSPVTLKPRRLIPETGCPAPGSD